MGPDYVVDPSTAYGNKLNWKSTAHTSAKVAIDVVGESLDIFTSLETVVGGLYCSEASRCTVYPECDVEELQENIPRELETLAEQGKVAVFPPNNAKDADKLDGLAGTLAIQ